MYNKKDDTLLQPVTEQEEATVVAMLALFQTKL